MLAACRLWPESCNESERTLGLRQATEPRQSRKELRNARQPASRRNPELVPADHRGITPTGAIVVEVGGSYHDAIHREQRLGEGAAIDAPGTLLGDCLQRIHQPGLVQEVACGKRATVSREEVPSPLEREEVCEHLERSGMHRRQRHTVTCEAQCGLDEAAPGHAPAGRPQLVERGR